MKINIRYRYDHEGMRTAKQSSRFGETLYPERLYQEHFTSTPPTVATKHIFVGQTRIASKVHHREQNASNRKAFMHANTFTYHADHLGSTNWVTDAEGEGYEHFQYSPYGESWVAEHLSAKTREMTHRFTGQELDEETGFYSFPARYYEPQTSRWMSVDPALKDYLPERPVDKEARKRNRNLPGMGGVFNSVSLQVYHYAGNNPARYVDPTGLNAEPGDSNDAQDNLWERLVNLDQRATEAELDRLEAAGVITPERRQEIQEDLEAFYEVLRSGRIPERDFSATSQEVQVPDEPPQEHDPDKRIPDQKAPLGERVLFLIGKAVQVFEGIFGGD